VTSQTTYVIDQLLLMEARAGNRQAADRLAARWLPRLARTARRLLRDEELAQEAVQEAWIGICRGWVRLNDPAKFPAWAFGILHRKTADMLRRRVRERQHFTSDENLPESSINANAEDRTAIDQAFATLSDEHRFIAILFFGEGLTLDEIARAADVPVGTAKSRLFHARQQLKATLTGE
jgi:RNA polymerase sigma-70 factor (ECF subfamily)